MPIYILIINGKFYVYRFGTNKRFFLNRKTSLKQKSSTDNSNFPGLNIDQTATNEDPSHYQELGDIKDDNAYQTLKDQRKK